MTTTAKADDKKVTTTAKADDKKVTTTAKPDDKKMTTARPDDQKTTTLAKATTTPSKKNMCEKHEDMDCGGGSNLSQETIVDNAEDCFNACLKEPKCKAWAWNKDTSEMKHYCFLHPTCENFVPA